METIYLFQYYCTRTNNWNIVWVIIPKFNFVDKDKQDEYISLPQRGGYHLLVTQINVIGASWYGVIQVLLINI